MATDLRAAAAVATSDVTSWMSAHGVPAGWTGDAADAAGHAMTAMGRRADAAVAALEKAVTAVEAYLDQMATRRAELDRLDDERVASTATASRCGRAPTAHRPTRPTHCWTRPRRCCAGTTGSSPTARPGSSGSVPTRTA